jgi:hypothetical protein
MLEGDTQAVRDKIRAAIDAFEGTTRAILAVAAQRGMPPGVIARKRAQAMLED